MLNLGRSGGFISSSFLPVAPHSRVPLRGAVVGGRVPVPIVAVVRVRRPRSSSAMQPCGHQHPVQYGSLSRPHRTTSPTDHRLTDGARRLNGTDVGRLEGMKSPLHLRVPAPTHRARIPDPQIRRPDPRRDLQGSSSPHRDSTPLHPETRISDRAMRPTRGPGDTIITDGIRRHGRTHPFNRETRDRQ